MLKQVGGYGPCAGDLDKQCITDQNIERQCIYARGAGDEVAWCVDVRSGVGRHRHFAESEFISAGNVACAINPDGAVAGVDRRRIAERE